MIADDNALRDWIRSTSVGELNAAISAAAARSGSSATRALAVVHKSREAPAKSLRYLRGCGPRTLKLLEAARTGGQSPRKLPELIRIQPMAAPADDLFETDAPGLEGAAIGEVEAERIACFAEALGIQVEWERGNDG